MHCVCVMGIARAACYYHEKKQKKTYTKIIIIIYPIIVSTAGLLYRYSNIYHCKEIALLKENYGNSGVSDTLNVQEVAIVL